MQQAEQLRLSKEVFVPEMSVDSGKKVSLRLWRAAKSDAVWVHREDLHFVIKHLHTESRMKADDGGCSGEEDGGDGGKSDEGWESERCHWDRRDLAWQGRVKDSEGATH